jgi:hypothetical protein
VPKYQNIAQLQTASYRRRNPGICFAICCKLSGFTRSSKANQLAFECAVDAVARTARELLDTLVTATVKARARATEQYRSVANTARATAGEPGATT